MKNILILHNSLDYNQSGVERVSFLLKKELCDHNYNCFEGCIKGENTTHQQDVFEYNFNDSRKKVSVDFLTYIQKYNIDIIIIQGLFDPNINHAMSYLKKRGVCKIVFCLHNAPSAHNRKKPLSVINRLKILIWYFVKFQMVIFDFRNHRINMLGQMYDIANRFILLSDAYVEEFRSIVKRQDVGKISCINNPLTFQPQQLNFIQKKKVALILGRLDDFQKNISAALRIWKIIEDSGICDWNLIIVGSGIDEQKLRDYAKGINIKNYSFLGATSEPENFYIESTLFMMTSRFEGWPMTLLEAQQCGCVPIAFNTFAALPEVIENGVNGYIVEKNDELQFAKKVIELMKNEPLRQQLAQNCINKCQNYSSKAIGDKWDSLLQRL